MSLRLKLLDIDHPLTFEESKLRQIEAHALIYLSCFLFTNSPLLKKFCSVFIRGLHVVIVTKASKR